MAISEFYFWGKTIDAAYCVIGWKISVCFTELINLDARIIGAHCYVCIVLSNRNWRYTIFLEYLMPGVLDWVKIINFDSKRKACDHPLMILTNRHFLSTKETTVERVVANERITKDVIEEHNESTYGDWVLVACHGQCNPFTIISDINLWNIKWVKWLDPKEVKFSPYIDIDE